MQEYVEKGQAYDVLLQRLHKLTEIGASFSIERDNTALLEQILAGARELTHADGGTLYIKENDDDGGFLRFEVMFNGSLAIHAGGTSGVAVDFPVIPLYKDQCPNETTVVSYCALHAEVVNVVDAYQMKGFDFSGTRKFDRQSGYRSQSFLTIPLKNHEHDVIGVLQLINRCDDVTGKTIPFSEADSRFVEALAATAAVSITGKNLIADLQNLFESFVKVIADAIDAKSPYTGGHCRRVPELTMMLAKAAIQTRQGPLKDFSMDSEDFYTLKTAAWLHDCGKIVTPEYIMDKPSKLSTIYDRIEVVDTRFEVLKRDAEIAWLRQQLADEKGTSSETIAQESDEALRADYAALASDREFLRRSNVGGEFMLPVDQQRVRTIAARTLYVDGQPQAFLSEEESRNLQIAKGTLLPEERAIINQHMDITIQMLEGLPFPKHMQNVPEYAGGHHERMDGKGYPKGLTRDQLSIPARIMAIADVFEALIACDRPYKKGKMLSECLFILGNMKENHHLDPDLFDVFIREKVYLQYAAQHVDAAQIDDVCEADIPGYIP